MIEERIEYLEKICAFLLSQRRTNHIEIEMVKSILKDIKDKTIFEPGDLFDDK